jgi:pimeloyl-ACP methyl ester carboxylesterase
MDALGHERFAVVGHDTGHFISYALAADHPERVERVALLEVPGPAGATPSPPLFVPEPINNKVWHIPFNRVDKVPEQLIRGREDIYFGYEFAIQPGRSSPRTWSTTTPVSSPTANPCAVASRSIARRTRPSHRTRSARTGR